MLSRSRRILLLLSPAAILSALLVSTEFVLRWTNPSLNVPFTTEVVQDGVTYLQINRSYLERYFPAGSPLVPELKPTLLKKQKEPGLFRVLCLGESSMFGVPYEVSATIPALVRRQLRHCYPGREIEVVNLAASAINTNVILDMAPEFLSLRPDVILIYTGHNEFYGPDGAGASWIERQIPGVTAWKYRLRELRLVRVFQRLLAGLARPDRGGEKNLMRQVSLGAEVRLDSPDAARVFANFDRNLRALLGRCRKEGVPVVLSDVSSNLSFPPFAPSGAGAGHVRGLVEAGSLYEAEGMLDSLHATDSTNAFVEYWLGKTRLRQGKTGEAVRLLDRARDLDLLKFRAPGQINAIIRGAAAGPGVRFISVDSLFRSQSGLGITDTSLFCEHLHPNARGYDLIARLFLQAMISERWVPGSRGPEHPLLPYNADSLAINWVDIAYGALSLRSLTGRWPFTHFTPGPSVLDAADSAQRAIVGDFYSRKAGWTEASLRFAEHAEAAGRAAEALRTFASLTDEYPHAYVFRYMYANALKQAGDLPAASTQYWECIALNGSYPYPRVDLGLLLINDGKFVEAQHQLDTAMALSSSQGSPPTLQATALYGLSAIAANEGRFGEAARLVEQSLHLVPTYRPAQSLRARLAQVPAIGIGAAGIPHRSPATPPGMRVRTGRFRK